MKKSGIDKRLYTKVADDQIKHATKLNVLIIRTIDLLFLMKNLEKKKEKKDIMIELLNSGGGG